MRKLLSIVLLVCAAGTAFAIYDPMTISCDACRDPHDHPEDYVNHAFNQVYGPDAWMSFDQADDFFIEGPNGQRVYVDVDFVMLGFGVEGLRLPFWPTNLLQFTLALPDGTVVKALRSKFQTPLPVPANAHASPPRTEAPRSDRDAGDEGGDEGEDEREFEPVDDPYEIPEIDGPVGFTGIEDPDEYGDFSEPEWCEEC